MRVSVRVSEDGERRSGAELLVLHRDESSCAGTRRADAALPGRGRRFLRVEPKRDLGLR